MRAKLTGTPTIVLAGGERLALAPREIWSLDIQDGGERLVAYLTSGRTVSGSMVGTGVVFEVGGEPRELRWNQLDRIVLSRDHWPAMDGVASDRRGMTWVVHRRHQSAVLVGCDSTSDAYKGDTEATLLLPMLAIRKQPALPMPPGTPIRDFYGNWSSAELRMTRPIAGLRLTSREAADRLVVAELGDGWQLAEFHDGNGGWNFWGIGELARGVRCWCAINDQSANPWDEAER
jgi:hypothetical protein